jgi:hypothetical protein
MPVFPLVGSVIVPPAAILPSRIAASSIAAPTRHLTLPAGLKNSSFAKMFPIRTSGVAPMACVMFS